MRRLFFAPLIFIFVACGGMPPTVTPLPPTSVTTVIALTEIVAATPAGTAPPTSGARISTPFIDKPGDIALYTTTAPPLITAPDLPGLLADNGIVNPTMMPVDASKPAVPTLIHGIGTIGKYLAADPPALPNGMATAPGCVHWAGPCNIRIGKVVNGKFVATGQVIPRIENRQLLIVDYANWYFPATGHVFNHGVLEIDEATGMVIRSYGWDGP